MPYDTGLFLNKKMRINIKPLSVNKCWQGKRFKTPEYVKYEKVLMMLLPKFTVPKGALKVTFIFGLSNALSDWDNPIKPFQDILQKKYGFNDKDIHEGVVKKVKVKKGEEFIEFEITNYKTKHTMQNIEKLLVDFGTYLLSEERRENFKMISEEGLEERLSEVNDADISRFLDNHEEITE